MAKPRGASSVGVAEDWPQYRGDSCHTGRQPALAEGEPMGLVDGWEAECPAPLSSSPIIDRGALYVGTERGLYSADSQTGTPRFHLETDAPVVTPIGTADRIVYGTADGVVVAVDPVSGDRVWQTSVAPLETDALTLAGRTVVVGTTAGLAGLALETGEGVWQWTGKDDADADAGVESETETEAEAEIETAIESTVELQSTSESTAAPAPASASTSTTKPTAETTIVGAPAADEERVYAGTVGETVVALDLETGAEQWTVPTDGQIVGGPTVDGDRVYVADDDGTLLALDAETGQTWFTYEPRTAFTTPPTVVGETAFIGGADGYLHVIETTFGNRKLRGLLFSKKGISLDGVPRGSPVVIGDTLLIGDKNGWLYGIDIDDDDFAWHVRTDAPVSGTPALTDDGLFAGFADGSCGRLTWDHTMPY